MENSVGQQAKEVLETIGDALLLIIKIFYFLLKSVYDKIIPPAPTPVNGKIVLITGTGHGIGRELAYVYAQEGATIVGVDVNEKGNEETFAEIKLRGNKRNNRFYTCDISNREKVLELSKKVKAEVGEVDILINNAGIMPCRRLEDHTPEIIEKIFQVNVYAHFWTIEAFLPDMKKRNSGHIVGISSCAGLFGIKNLTPYCSSKFAVKGLMEALYEELRLNPNNNIKLTTIFPYMTNTGLCKKPVVRFSNAMPLLNPADLAREIMKAQRNNMLQVTVPNYVNALITITKLLPYPAAFAIADFFDAYVEADN